MQPVTSIPPQEQLYSRWQQEQRSVRNDARRLPASPTAAQMKQQLYKHQHEHQYQSNLPHIPVQHKDGLNLLTTDIPGAQPKKFWIPQKGKKREQFYDNAQIEQLHLKDKYGSVSVRPPRYSNAPSLAQYRTEEKDKEQASDPSKQTPLEIYQSNPNPVNERISQRPDFANVNNHYDRMYNKRINYQSFEPISFKEKNEYLDVKLNQMIRKAPMPTPTTITKNLAVVDLMRDQGVLSRKREVHLKGVSNTKNKSSLLSQFSYARSLPTKLQTEASKIGTAMSMRQPLNQRVGRYAATPSHPLSQLHKQRQLDDFVHNLHFGYMKANVRQLETGNQQEADNSLPQHSSLPDLYIPENQKIEANQGAQLGKHQSQQDLGAHQEMVPIQFKPAHFYFHHLGQRRHIHTFDTRVEDSNVIPRARGGSESSHSTEARDRYKPSEQQIFSSAYGRVRPDPALHAPGNYLTKIA